MEPSPFESGHPDPADALFVAAQKVTELMSVAALAGQVVGQIRARQLAARLAADEAELARARTMWAEVLNNGWRADAGLFDVTRAWAAALPWAHAEEDAARAVQASEQRMRDLHPYAMDRYDQELQARLAMPDARPMLARAEAMLATVDSFALHPRDGIPDPALRLSDLETDKLRRVLGTLGRQSAQLAEAGQKLDPKIAEAAVSSVAPEIAAHVAEGVAAGNSVLPAAGPPPRPTVSHFGPQAHDWVSSVHQGVAATALRKSAGGRHAAHRGNPKSNTLRPGRGAS